MPLKSKRRRGRFSGAAFLLGLVLTGVSVMGAEWLAARPGGWDDQIFDAFQRARPRPWDADQPVRIVDIDETALATYGQWPWPRPYLAELIERLRNAGAAVIGFDMLFAEHDRTSPEIADALREKLSGGDSAPLVAAGDLTTHDVLFARALSSAATVLGVLQRPGAGAAHLPGPQRFSILGPDPTPALRRPGGLAPPLPAFLGHVAGLGVIGVSAADAGMVRILPAAVATAEGPAPAFALEALRVALGQPGYLMKTVGGPGAVDVESVRIGPLQVPLSADGTMRIRWAGPQPRRVVSVAEVLGDNSPNAPWKAEIRDRIVLIGASAPGISYAVNTPLGEGRLGVELHAEAIEQIAVGDFLTRPAWAGGAERLAIVLGGLIISTLTALRRMPLATGIAAMICGGALWASWQAFVMQGLLFGPSGALLGALVPLAGTGAFNYARSEAERRAIRSQFEHYLAPEVIEEIAADPEAFLTPGGEARELAILFSDVRGFSTITENMSPTEVVQFVNGFLTPVSEAVLDSGGTIDKYMGDAVMAFWNAPRPSPTFRRDAVRGCFAIRDAVAKMNEERIARGEPMVGIGIGLNAGDCAVGSMGSARRLEYSCIGDAVNLASRLEGLTKMYGVWSCVGSAVVKGLDDVTAYEIDRVVVKGRTKPEPVHALVAETPPTGPMAELGAALAEARAAYAARDWDAAEILFRALPARSIPEFDATVISELYLGRIEEYRDFPPPEDWSGEYAARTK